MLVSGRVMMRDNLNVGLRPSNALPKSDNDELTGNEFPMKLIKFELLL